MMQKLLFILIALLWSSVGYAQRDTTEYVAPQDVAVDSSIPTNSVQTDSLSSDTVYYYIHRRHRTYSHSITRPTLMEKAAKRRHKALQKKARERRNERRHERMAATHKRAKARTSSHRSSRHSHGRR